MRVDALTNTAVRMVVAYYNRILNHDKKLEDITNKNVCIKSISENSDGLISIVLLIDNDESEEYHVDYKNGNITSYIISDKIQFSSLGKGVKR